VYIRISYLISNGKNVCHHHLYNHLSTSHTSNNVGGFNGGKATFEPLPDVNYPVLAGGSLTSVQNGVGYIRVLNRHPHTVILNGNRSAQCKTALVTVKYENEPFLFYITSQYSNTLCEL